MKPTTLTQRLTQAVEHFFNKAADIAGKVDELPVAPSKLAERAASKFQDARESRAAEDPEWSEIQRRRKGDGTEPLLLVGPNLSFADLTTQREIEERLTPAPWWLAPIERISQTSMSSGLRRVARGAQRVRRGWDDTHTWDLGTNLCLQLADQLEHLAETTHGWPASDDFETFEDWQQALREKAVALRRASGSVEHERAQEKWFKLTCVTDVDVDVVEEARAEMHRLEQADRDAAAGAMHWVADHLGQLWD